MLEVFCILLILLFAFGQGHLAFVNGLLWFLDEQDGTEMKFSFETCLGAVIVPVAMVIVSVELYFLFRV
jgi:hypothetical protein